MGSGMTKQTKSSKLALRTQSIRTLTGTELAAAAGGSFGTLPLTSIAVTSSATNTISAGTYTPSSSMVR